MNGVRHVITQGEYMVSTEPDLYISTLLGSCVACCLWDPTAMVGGMNHMLLTQHGDAARHSDLAGINAMEMLINDLQKRGALRSRLQAKVFGGAQMFDGLSRIGAANCSFVLDYLAREGILCTGQSLGGIPRDTLRSGRAPVLHDKRSVKIRSWLKNHVQELKRMAMIWNFFEVSQSIGRVSRTASVGSAGL